MGFMLGRAATEKPRMQLVAILSAKNPEKLIILFKQLRHIPFPASKRIFLEILKSGTEDITKSVVMEMVHHPRYTIQAKRRVSYSQIMWKTGRIAGF